MPDADLLIPRCPRCGGTLTPSDTTYLDHRRPDCEAEWQRREKAQPSLHPIQVDTDPRCRDCGQDLIALDADLGTFYRHEPAYCDWIVAEHMTQVQALETAETAKRADPNYRRICRCGAAYGHGEPIYDWCGVPAPNPADRRRYKLRNRVVEPTLAERVRKRLTGAY